MYISTDTADCSTWEVANVNTDEVMIVAIQDVSSLPVAEFVLWRKETKERDTTEELKTEACEVGSRTWETRWSQKNGKTGTNFGTGSLTI